MGDSIYFGRVASASAASVQTLNGPWGDWKDNLGTFQVLGTQFTKADTLLSSSEGDQIIHPNPTIPLGLNPTDWLNTRLMPDLQAEQRELQKQFIESRLKEGQSQEDIDAFDINEACASHADMCKSLVHEFNLQREAMMQSIPKVIPAPKAAHPHLSTLQMLQRAMLQGEGLIEANQVQAIRNQQQNQLQQQYQQHLQFSKTQLATTAASRPTAPVATQQTAAPSNPNAAQTTTASSTTTNAPVSMQYRQHPTAMPQPHQPLTQQQQQIQQQLQQQKQMANLAGPGLPKSSNPANMSQMDNSASPTTTLSRNVTFGPPPKMPSRMPDQSAPGTYRP